MFVSFESKSVCGHGQNGLSRFPETCWNISVGRAAGSDGDSFDRMIKEVVMSLSRNRWLRKLVLPLFERFNPGDITVKHHYTQEPVRLHSFRHKGYWWYGSEREADTMEAFQKLIRPGDQVIEVGAHIGYIAMWLGHLVGPTGHVFTFEPGENNLPYTRQNVARHRNITLVEKAVGDHCGVMTFHMESLTGQNNSLVNDFEGLEKNQQNAVKAEMRTVEVEVITLDQFAKENRIQPRLIKIDVEGFEFEALSGMIELMRHARPIIMVEVQRRQDEIYQLMTELNYDLRRADGSPITCPTDFQLNTFCSPKEKLSELSLPGSITNAA